MTKRANFLSRMFDGFAERNPNGLVARFRRRFGKLTPEQLEQLAGLAERAAKAAEKVRKK